MSLSFFSTYARNILVRVPLWHWMVMGLFAFLVFLLAPKRRALYGPIMMGFAAFIGAFLLDTAVLIRYSGSFPHASGFNLDLFHGVGFRKVESLSNIVVFLPYGLFISEYLASAKRFSARRRLGLTTLAGFGLSLCIECLQWVLHVGFFELSDLVKNTIGAFWGAMIAVSGRALWNRVSLYLNDR